MALSTSQRRTFARIVSLGHFGLALWCIVRLIQVSGLPSHYYQYRNHTEGFAYPVHDVGVWCSVIGAELVATAWVLFYARSQAYAAVILAVLYGVATCGFGVIGMHAPPYYGMHVVFLLFSTGWLAIVAVAAGIAGRHGAESEATRLQAALAPVTPVRPDDSL